MTGTDGEATFRGMYAKLDSWHEVHDTRSLCGLEIGDDAPHSPALPLNERSCETCLRLARHMTEAGDTSVDRESEPPMTEDAA